MSDNIKNKFIVVGFVAFLVIFFICNFIKADTEISLTERRKLAKFPEITIDNLLDGKFSKDFDKYSTDQIIGRDNFRKIKAVVELDLFNKKDNNDIYMYNGSLIKIEYPLNEKSVLNVANKLNEIKNTYLTKENNCYYSIIPDKNYFTDRDKYIGMDYQKLQEIMINNIDDMEYINIFGCLELEDYYITDIHWKQENLQKVVDKIANKMIFDSRIKTSYKTEYITDLDGLYSRELPVKTKQDEIIVLTNDIIESSIAYNYENRKTSEVYNKEKISSNDKYDVYLSGATPLIEIRNPNAKTDRELIVFRDSFASTLIPLFTEAYSKITLVDIRYMRSSDVSKYIDFIDQDVLFLYSTMVINNSGILR